MAIYKTDFVNIELNSGSIHRSFLNHSIGSGDKMANRFGVSLFRNGEPVSAESATVIGVFMAPDGNNYGINETSWPGSTGKEGNKAWVQLPEICYAVTGQFCLAIKLSGGGIEGTMRIVDGTVDETGEGGAVVPTSTIPTTEEIIAAYEEAVEVVGGSVRFDAEQTLSDSEKETARNNIGSASEAELAELEDDVTNLEDDIADIQDDIAVIRSKTDMIETGMSDDVYRISGVEWTPGFLKADGTINADSYYKTSSLIFVPKGFICVFNSYASTSTFYFQYFNADGTFKKTGRAGKSINVYVVTTDYADEDQYIRITTREDTVSTSNVKPVLVPYAKKNTLSNAIGEKIELFPELYFGFLNNDGTATVDNTYIHTGIIKIPKGYVLRANVNNSSSTFCFLNYTSGGIFDSVGISGGSDGTINIYAYESDRYVSLCSKGKYTYSELGILLDKIDYEMVFNTSNITENMGTIIGSTTYGDGYISSSDGSVNGSENYTYSSLIPICKGQTIEFNAGGSASVFILMEATREYGLVTGIVTGDSGYKRIKYKADHDMLVRICTRDDNAAGTPFVPANDFKSGWKIYYDSEEKVLNGKKVVIIGDSLIYGNICKPGATWCEILANKTGAIVYNYGINGSSVANVADRHPMCLRYDDIAELPSADFIILEGGANDFNTGVLIGNESDNDSTFKGALSEIIDGMREINPKAKILFMTTYHRNDNTNSAGLKYIDYVTAMKEVCYKRSVPCFDNYSDSGILFPDTNMNWADEGIYLGGTKNNHISPEGYEYLYPKYYAFIMSN